MTLKTTCLSEEEKERYSRQIMLPEIGIAGQEKLKAASILIAGAGGLGSLSALYLAAAGIGTIRIADSDHVEKSNLNRQILHRATELGKSKTASAVSQLQNLNSHVIVDPRQVQINKRTMDSLADGMDILVDATDNLDTRMLLNQTALSRKIPYVFGGVTGFEGMATTFLPWKTACLGCLFHSGKKQEGAKGVIGAAPGIIASIQCMEVIKLILGIGRPLENRLVKTDGLSMRIREIQIRKNPDCTCCS